MSTYGADDFGWFGGVGAFGGRFMPEALIAALDELDIAWQKAMVDPAFVADGARVVLVGEALVKDGDPTSAVAAMTGVGA